MLSGRGIADHFEDDGPEHAVTIALAGANEAPAALMPRQIGWRFLQREGRENDGRLYIGML